MELIDYRGQVMPYVQFPGGKLLLGAGPEGSLYLQNRWDDTYAYEGMEVYLNPHYMLRPDGTIELQRHDGRPSGMCFTKDSETHEYVANDVKERLYLGLGESLQAVFNTYPNLLGHVTRTCREADVLKAQNKLDGITGDFVRAAQDLQEAKAALDGVPANGDGPGCFVVLTFPEGFAPEGRAKIYSSAWSFAESIAKTNGLGEVPLIIDEG